MPVEKEGRADLPETIRVKKGWCGYRDLPMERGKFRKVLHLKTSRARKNKILKIWQGFKSFVSLPFHCPG